MKKSNSKPYSLQYLCCALALLLIVLTSPACAPVFSELQTARTVGKGQFEVVPSYTTVAFTEDGTTDGTQNQLGLQLAYGVSEKVDIRARYERVWGKDGKIGDGVSVAGIGPKIALLPNQIAFSVPIGRAFGDETSDTWEIQPSLLFTLSTLQDRLDITLSPKYLVIFCEKCDDLVAVNLGLSFGDVEKTWAIRPEYGLLFNPGESGFFGQFSIGLAKKFGM